MQGGAPIVWTVSLAKSYRNHDIIKNVNLNLKQGEIYTVLGTKGSGKTTLLKLLAGIITPTAGSIEMFGMNLSKKVSRKKLRRVGYMNGGTGFLSHLTVAENLDIHRKLMGVPGKQCIDDTLHRFYLAEFKNICVKELPNEIRRRLNVARALLHRPELLLLDEPVQGMDSYTQSEIFRLIHEHAASQQMTIVFTARRMEDVPSYSSQVGIIHQGEVIKQIKASDLSSQSMNHIIIKVNDVAKASVLLEQEMGIYNYRVVDHEYLWVFGKLNHSADINRILIRGNVDVYELRFGGKDDDLMKFLEEDEC
ncbi:ABC transporter ATP-binding protein [Paenibacillus donghaensis]|uniref:ATP-binding cassette domain-containing protein n=1 Tax=Paenibacillus donghaensis TaxID=414771 RepID=UPI00188374BC|nr:ABC transporter ATP-binding protein [Paenibacillus donghaensis]MBE9916054.1 ABC transporter ATP-binding protein [Paenibacillus donghaensis]